MSRPGLSEKSVLDDVLLGLQTGAESLLEVGHLLPGRLLGGLDVCLVRFLRLAGPAAVDQRPGGGADRSALAGVAGYASDERARRGSSGRAADGRALRRLRVRSGRLGIGLGLLLELERIRAGVLDRPLVAIRLVLGLRASGLTLAGEDRHVDRSRQRLLRGRLRMARDRDAKRERDHDSECSFHGRPPVLPRNASLRQRAWASGVQAPKTETTFPALATATTIRPVCSLITKLNARPASTPWRKIWPSSRRKLRIGVERFSPLAFVVERVLSLTFTWMNCGMLRFQGRSATQSPSSWQSITLAAVQRIRSWFERSSARLVDGRRSSAMTIGSKHLISLLMELPPEWTLTGRRPARDSTFVHRASASILRSSG